jgi:DNA polymerase III delta prime subunit
MQVIFTEDTATAQPTATRLLGSAISAQRLSHAYLLTGRSLASKWQMARELAQYLNCEKADKASQGACLHKGADDKTLSFACQNCRWLHKDEHPKAWYVLSNEAGKSGKIPVEAARNLSEELARTTNYMRIVVVEDASESAFHRPAANALLKTIEEPRSSCLFLLFAPATDDVLSTIVSRCQVLPLNNLPSDNLGLLEEIPLSRALASRAAQVSVMESEIAQKLKTVTYLSDQPRGSHTTSQALELGLSLLDLLEDEHPVESVFDTLMAIELSRMLKKGALTTAVKSAYLSDFLRLCEEAKQRSDHYVSKKALCESFVLSWHQLRHSIS